MLTGEKKWILIGRIIQSQDFRDKFQSFPQYSVQPPPDLRLHIIQISTIPRPAFLLWQSPLGLSIWNSKIAHFIIIHSKYLSLIQQKYFTKLKKKIFYYLSYIQPWTWADRESGRWPGDCRILRGLWWPRLRPENRSDTGILFSTSVIHTTIR